MMRRLLLAALLIVAAPLVAAAQSTPMQVGVAAPVIGPIASLSVSSSTGNVVLPGTWPTYPAVLLTNDGSSELFWNLGTSNSVTATTSSAPLAAGSSICVAINPGTVRSTQNTYIAAITSTSTSTLRVQASGWCAIGLGGGGSGGGGGAVTANQGTAAALSGAWPIEVTDGTNGPAAVKAPSTAPLATDKAVVVAISPNSVNPNGQATMANSAPVVEANNSPLIPFSASPTSSVTRPANTTTYTANTGWCHTASACATVFTFTGACRVNGGQVVIPTIDLWLSDHVSTAMQGILWVFNVTPGTVINDDAAFNIATGDFPNLTGSMSGFPFTMVSPQSSPNNSGVTVSGTTYPMQCAAGTTTFYAMVQVVNAYPPTSAEVLNVTLHTIGVN
jgi:hypothetical protein